MTLDEALSRRVGDDAGEQTDRADGVVVAGDRVLHLVGVAVRVEDRDDRDTELVGLVDGEMLFLRVYDPDRRGGLREVTNTTKRTVELDQLALLDEQLFLGETLGGVVEVELFELLHASEALRHGLEVGEEPTEPTLVDIGLAHTLGLLGDGALRLFLRADEEDGAAVRDGVLDVVVGLVDVRQ